MSLVEELIVTLLVLHLGAPCVVVHERCCGGTITDDNHRVQERKHKLGANLTFATSFCNGRLGNVISAFASLYAYQKDFGLTPLMPKGNVWLLCYYFQCRKEILILETEFPQWSSMDWKGFDPDYGKYLWNRSTPNPSLGRFLDIGQYPVKVKYFYKHLRQLQVDFLTLKDQFTDDARQKIQLAKMLYTRSHHIPENETISYISIHSRNGDYASHLGLRNLTLVGEDYFTRAMDVFRKSEMHPLFIISSNDMKWAREKIIPSNDDCYFLGTGIQTREETPPNSGITGILASPEIGNDLAMLTQVNYSIMTYGTFGMWGALLAGSKRVIMPQGYNADLTESELLAAKIPGFTFI